MFLNLIIRKFVDDHSIRECCLSCLNFRKIIHHFSIRVFLLYIIICEIHNLVSIRIWEFLYFICKNDFRKTWSKNSLNFSILLGSLCNFLSPSVIRMILLRVINSPNFRWKCRFILEMSRLLWFWSWVFILLCKHTIIGSLFKWCHFLKLNRGRTNWILVWFQKFNFFISS